MYAHRLPPGVTVTAQIERKKSRFITWLRRVETDEAARALVHEARKTFPDARHHCSAWIINPVDQQPVTHSSDDGEPAGTAGRPMLEALAGSGLGDIGAVVIRYFGGTLLGTGGLSRAYSDAVTAALAVAPRLEVVSSPAWSVSLDHRRGGRIEAELRDRGFKVESEYLASGVELTVTAGDGADLQSMIATLLGSPVELRPLGDRRTERPL